MGDREGWGTQTDRDRERWGTQKKRWGQEETGETERETGTQRDGEREKWRTQKDGAHRKIDRVMEDRERDRPLTAVSVAPH